MDSVPGIEILEQFRKLLANLGKLTQRASGARAPQGDGIYRLRTLGTNILHSSGGAE
jgi:hypothetical protein